jgi:hypothetical protein
MRVCSRLLSVVAVSSLLVACTPTESSPTGTGGTGGGAGTSGGAGTTGTGTGTAGTTGAAGTGSTTGTAGTTGAAGTGTTTGTAGTTGAAGTGAAGTTPDGGAPNPDAGPVTTAGCAGKDYQLCIDFESGIDTNMWTGGSANAIVTTHPAHGTHSYRLYPNGGSLLKSAKLGTITNQMWGRFYVHFDPGAPGGHGNIVGAFDNATNGGNWYEMGWQFDAMMGVFHLASGAEKALRSTPLLLDNKWHCVEFLFDASAGGNMPKWWLDGTEVSYYMPTGGPTPIALTFKRVEVGFTPYAGLGLKMPDGKGDQTETRVLMEMWLDDVAFDSKRIGCIAQ